MFRKIFGQKAHDSGNSSWGKTEKKKKTVIPKRQAKWTHAKSNSGVNQVLTDGGNLSITLRHSFFPAVTTLSWNLWGELHLSVETVWMYQCNTISHFAMLVFHEENPQRAYKRY